MDEVVEALRGKADVERVFGRLMVWRREGRENGGNVQGMREEEEEEEEGGDGGERGEGDEAVRAR